MNTLNVEQLIVVRDALVEAHNRNSKEKAILDETYNKVILELKQRREAK